MMFKQPVQVLDHPIRTNLGSLESFATVSVLNGGGDGPHLRVDMPSPTLSSTYPASDHQDSGPEESSSDAVLAHPSGLDSPQVGIDFVLSLEQRCLKHTTRLTSRSKASSGHALTAHAPLLTTAPDAIHISSKWRIPAMQVERLLQPSFNKNLCGEISPLQAWSRIRSHPGFSSWEIEDLEKFRSRLLKEIKCHGFGAMIDEETFERLLDDAFTIRD